jgi:hypothetical protein
VQRSKRDGVRKKKGAADDWLLLAAFRLRVRVSTATCGELVPMCLGLAAIAAACELKRITSSTMW